VIMLRPTARSGNMSFCVCVVGGRNLVRWVCATRTEVARFRMLKTFASWPGVTFNVDLHDLEGRRLCPLFLIIYRNVLNTRDVFPLHS